SDAHEGRACSLHHGLDVGEVEVDQAGGGDQVGDALHTGEQNLFGAAEGVEHAHRAVADREQPVVRDDDEGVDLFAQAGDAGLGLVGAATSLEGEGPGDHADGERADRLGDLGDHWCATGAGATALSGRHEDHVSALEHLFALFAWCFAVFFAALGIRTGPQTAGQLTAHVQLDIGVTHQKGLGIGVDGDELHAFEADLDHPVDRIDTASANADDLDYGQVVLRGCHVNEPF